MFTVYLFYQNLQITTEKNYTLTVLYSPPDQAPLDNSMNRFPEEFFIRNNYKFQISVSGNVVRWHYLLIIDIRWHYLLVTDIFRQQIIK